MFGVMRGCREAGRLYYRAIFRQSRPWALNSLRVFRAELRIRQVQAAVYKKYKMQSGL